MAKQCSFIMPAVVPGGPKVRCLLRQGHADIHTGGSIEENRAYKELDGMPPEKRERALNAMIEDIDVYGRLREMANEDLVKCLILGYPYEDTHRHKVLVEASRRLDPDWIDRHIATEGRQP